MNVGIVTQPLVANYGGFLQNYALQKALVDIGCNPITLDLETHLNISYTGYLKELIKLFVKRSFLGSNKKYPTYVQKRPKVFDDFVKEYLLATDKVKQYYPKLIDENHLDAIIVGSDQVWRPKFNVYPEDMFLAFLEGRDIKRISYAASFGVDEWEYEPEMGKRCGELLSYFNAISVREKVGVKLCNDHWGIKAVTVLDPTLLHDASFYNELCKDIPTHEEKYVAVYTLGLSNKAKQQVKTFASNNGWSTRYFTSDANYTLSVPEWLATLRDASFVITDSFHGTAFSIIYNKQFFSIINKSRGTSRFESILADYGLSDRLLDSGCLQIPETELKIDWDDVNKRRSNLKKGSWDFLRKAVWG